MAQAAKDLSNAGILGTLSIMIENSGRSAVIELDSIPKRAETELPDWLACFQSFGFVFSASPKNSNKIISLFREREITATIIGEVTGDPTIILRNGSESKILFDFRRNKITGISYQSNRPM